MIKYNPQFKSDGTQNGALTTAPSDSIIFDVPGKCIWVKGVKLLGSSQTYTFSHDNYITLTNTPGNPEDILIGVNTTALKNAIDTTYGIVNASTDGLAPMFSTANKATAAAATTYNFLGIAGTTLKWYSLPWRNVRINAETTDKLGVNDTSPLIISQGTGISVTWDSSGKKIVITNTAPDVNHNTDSSVAQTRTVLNKDYPLILKGSADSTGIIAGVNFNESITYNPSTSRLLINSQKVVTVADIYVGATASAAATSGLVPAAASAQRNYFLRGDGTWATPDNTNTWRPVKVEGTQKLASTADTDALDFHGDTGIEITYDATSKKINIKNTAPDINHNTDFNVQQTPKTDNVNRPLMMINGGTSSGEQTSTTMFSTGIYANASTKMITANGFIKTGSDKDHVLLGDGSHDKFLLPLNTSPASTIATNIGSWTPISGRYVYRQNWTDSSTGGDTADFCIYLDGNLTANICLDGYFNTLCGYRVIGKDNTEVLLAGGGTKLISDFATSGHNHDGSYVTAVGAGSGDHANELYYTKNGSNTYFTVPYATISGYTNRFRSHGTSNWDANDLTYPVAENYGQSGGSSNYPGGYGSVFQILANGGSSLGGQFFWSINHNSTSSTKDLYFRAGNNLGWQNDWKRIAWASEIPTVNNASLTLQTAGTTQTIFYANDDTNRTFNVTCANIGAATSDHNHDGRYHLNNGGWKSAELSSYDYLCGWFAQSSNGSYAYAGLCHLNGNMVIYTDGLFYQREGAYYCLDNGNTYVNNGVGVINGNTITSVTNSTNATYATYATHLNATNLIGSSSWSWNPFGFSALYWCWGESLRNSNLGSDTGDIRFYLAGFTSNGYNGSTGVCMNIDGCIASASLIYALLGFIHGNYNSANYLLLSNGSVKATSDFATSDHTHTSITDWVRETRQSKNSSNSEIESVSGWRTSGFIEIYRFAPPTLYFTTYDRPAPYGIGFGNGSESGGIMPIGSGDYLQEIRFYGANSGPTIFTFGRLVWDSTTYDSRYTNHYATYLSINSTNGNLSTSGTLTSTIATGTAPINVSSTTVCGNLNADLLDGYHYDGLPYIKRENWWNYSDTHDADTLMSGTTFAYSRHNAPTTGIIVAFNSINNTGYPLLLQGLYGGENLYFRNRNGDNGTWQAWRYVIHSGNIGSQSVYSATYATYTTHLNASYLNGSSGWAWNPFGVTQYWCWGEQFYYGAMSGDTGDLRFYLAPISSAGGAGICMNIDGHIATLSCVYAGSNMYAAHFYENSDARLKHDIIPISKSIRQFKFHNDERTYYGFIALELEILHPELVDSSQEYKKVNYDSAICYYIAELENKVQKLEDEINKLKNK